MRTAARAQLAFRRALPSDVDGVSDLLAEAFLVSPVGDWLIGDLSQRRDVYVKYFEVFVRYGLRFGIVDVNADLSAAAIWFPLDEHGLNPDDYDQQLADACGVHLPRFQQLDDTFAAHHPTGVFHHYLAFIGVAPPAQGRGIGGALLAHHHQWCDRDQIPVYLEASTPRNRDLYARHGYTAREPFHLPEGGPPLWSMWRNPQPLPPHTSGNRLGTGDIAA